MVFIKRYTSHHYLYHLSHFITNEIQQEPYGTNTVARFIFITVNFCSQFTTNKLQKIILNRNNFQSIDFIIMIEYMFKNTRA